MSFKNISYHQLPKIREKNLNLQDQYYVTILKPGWRLKAGGAGDNPGRWVSLVDADGPPGGRSGVDGPSI